MFEGQTIVITGAASGIGRAWAEGFTRDGARVVAADINAEGLAQLDVAHTLTVDVSDGVQVEQMVASAVALTGRIDVLFNNAGVAYGHMMEASPLGDFEHHVAIHLFACVNGMRSAIPHMRKQGRGRIINTISRMAESDQPRSSGYAASKAAIWSASRVTARELDGVDISVNMLIPGPTRTPIWGRDLPQLQEPEATYATAKMLASFPADGPTGKVFWNEKEYHMFGEQTEPKD